MAGVKDEVGGKSWPAPPRMSTTAVLCLRLLGRRQQMRPMADNGTIACQGATPAADFQCQQTKPANKVNEKGLSNKDNEQGQHSRGQRGQLHIVPGWRGRIGVNAAKGARLTTDRDQHEAKGQGQWMRQNGKGYTGSCPAPPLILVEYETPNMA